MANYGLTRASDRKQEQSPAVQEDSIRQHAQALGLANVQVLHEPLGTSGKKTNFADRPQGKWLLENLKAGDALIVGRMDRFGRTTSDILNTIETLNQRGVRLYIINFQRGQSLDISSSVGKLIITIFAGFAQFERDNMIDRLVEAQQWRKRNGYAWTNPPFGFKTVPLPQDKSSRGKPLKVVVPIQPDVVAWIVEQLDSGRPLYHVARDLYNRGVRCNRKLWAPRKNCNGLIEPKRVRAAYKFWKAYIGDETPGAAIAATELDRQKVREAAASCPSEADLSVATIQFSTAQSEPPCSPPSPSA